MGYTKHTYDLMLRHQPSKKHSHLMLGDQICYFGTNYGMYMHEYMRKYHSGSQMTIIDIKPEKHAEQHDLRSEKVLELGQFDIICDAGTSEHVAPSKKFHGLYEAHKHIYELCKVGGIMIHENPKTGNWKGHGDWYKTEKFYHQLADIMGLELLEVGSHPAMSNTKNGWNVFAVLKKVDDRPFMPLDMFEDLEYYTE